MNQQAISMHQSAEWVMQALKGSFPHVNNFFIYEENVRE